jgi:hypothetical protein
MVQLIIVKRGALSTLRFLEQSCKDIPGLRVIWDRRRGSDRRTAQNAVAWDRRAAGRRRQAPLSWTTADHVLAAGQEDEASVSVGLVDMIEKG